LKVLSLAWNRDGTMLAAGSDALCRIWRDPCHVSFEKPGTPQDADAKEVSVKQTSAPLDPRASVRSSDPTAAPSPVGHCLELRGHTDTIEQVAWHPGQSSILATASADKSVRFWDLRSQREKARFLDMNLRRFSSFFKSLLHECHLYTGKERIPCMEAPR
jgi:WD40 repeat protein